MARAALALCLVLASATAVACADEREQRDKPRDRAVSAPVAGQRVLVTQDDRSLPRGCRPAAIAGLLGELFDALNRGDRAAARALVIDREMLALLEQPAAGRPLRLRAVIVGFAHGLGQIEFRAAGGLIGKGAVDCDARRFMAVGVGAEHARMAPLCGRRTSAVVLACVRHWS